MKIAVVCPYSIDAWGGVQGQAAQLVTWLRETGHDAWLVAPGSGGPAGTRHVGGAVRVPANRSVAPLALNPLAGRASIRAVAGADVVHIHEPFAPVVSLVTLLGRTAPKVGTFHADAGRLVGGFYRAARPVLRRWADRLAVATAVSPIAQAAAAAVIRARLIPNAVDASAFSPHEEKAPNRVVFVGRDEPRKGLDILLGAWPKVLGDVPAAELVVIGAMRSDAPPGVRFLGPVSEAEKRGQLSAASILCAPNLGGESFGLVVAEGMAAECAVVASGIPAFAAVLGDVGVLVAPGDTPALADALRRLLTDSERVRRLGEAGPRRVEAFDRAPVLAEYLAVYEEAAA